MKQSSASATRACMGTTVEPMQTDTAEAGPSTSKKKGDPLVEKKDAPWVEKYRPKTLDDVAAHKEIIDTSKFARKPLQVRSLVSKSATLPRSCSAGCTQGCSKQL